jgi:outer membrane protein TolC
MGGNMIRRFNFAAITIILVALSETSKAAPLSLEEFLEQVKKNHDGYKASSASSEAASGKISDAEMIYATNVFATIQSAVDKKEQVPAAMRGEQTDYSSYQMGVSKLSSFGTAAKLYYSTSHTKIKGAGPMFVPEPEWYEGGPTLEVSHPLWRNANGLGVAKGIQIQEHQANVTRLTESLKRKFTLAESEGAYWRLVLARENVRTCRENLDRAKKIIDWNRRRVSSELADRADLIQAQALGEVREIELTMALDEERSASHAFNNARGLPSGSVKEELSKITPDIIAKLPIPQRSGEREDLKAALAGQALATLAADLGNGKHDPSVDVFASGTMNGRKDNYSAAFNEAKKAKRNTYAVGIKINAPLGGSTSSEVKAGYAKDIEAASLSANRKRFENDREWEDLGSKLKESKARLTLSQKIEDTQKRKLEAERDRQSKGRSTMFQVMQAESDLATSQLNVIRTKAEILGIIARMKTFGGEQ